MPGLIPEGVGLQPGLHRYIQVGQGRNRFLPIGVAWCTLLSPLGSRTAIWTRPKWTPYGYQKPITYLASRNPMSQTLWHAETEFFLEAAIRTVPASPYARQAYAFLENTS